MSPNNRGSALSTARRTDNGPRPVIRFNKKQYVSQPIRRLSAVAPISMSAPDVIANAPTKSPARDGASLLYGEYGNHRGFAADRVSFPCNTFPKKVPGCVAAITAVKSLLRSTIAANALPAA